MEALRAWAECIDGIGTGVNRHASVTRIGLMDSTVPIEALVSEVTHPRRGCLSVETDAHARFQIPIGDSYSTGYRIIIVPDVQPLTGLWGMVGNIIVLQICKP